MNPESLVRLLETNDLYGLMLQTCRMYANQHCPGWRCGSIAIRIGALSENMEHVLLVLPNPLLQTQPLPQGSASCTPG